MGLTRICIELRIGRVKSCVTIAQMVAINMQHARPRSSSPHVDRSNPIDNAENSHRLRLREVARGRSALSAEYS
jgi:hypothetical protein